MRLGKETERAFRLQTARNLTIMEAGGMVIPGHKREIEEAAVENLRNLLKTQPGGPITAKWTGLALAMAAEKYAISSQTAYEITNADNFDIEIHGDLSERFCKEHLLKDLKKRYKVGKSIGAGKYGEVFQAYDKVKKRDVALKMITLPEVDRDGLRDLKRELDALKKLTRQCSSYIAPIYDWYCLSEGKFAISMEYVTGTVLAKYKPKSLLEGEKLIREIALGIECLQKAGIIHMDLHLGNVMVDAQGYPKIIDFGLSCFTGISCSIIQRSLGWEGFESIRPPELVSGTIEPTLEAYKMADVWMLGQLIDNFTKFLYPLLREWYKGLARQMMKQDPSERPDMKEVITQITELQKFREPIAQLSFEFKREPWEIHQCAKTVSKVHQITFKKTIDLLYD